MTVFDDDLDRAGAPAALRTAKPATWPATRPATWMVTFLDLVLLLFGFFVLLFALRAPDAPWGGRPPLGVLPTDAAPAVALETTPARAAANIAALAPSRGAATEYLAGILGEALARQERLAGTTMSQEGDQIVLYPPSGFLSRPGAPDASHGKALADLAALLDRLDNRVAVVARIARTDTVAWGLGLARATEAAEALRAAGFSRALDVRLRPAVPGAEADLFISILGEREGS